MKIFRITGKNNQWLLINLAAVIFVELDHEGKGIIFDGMIRIDMEELEYKRVQKEIWGIMFDLP